jgi:cytochrome c peroxidase
VPNYLGAPVIAPDGRRAWVPSKQDNIKRGTLRDGQQLDFQNTIRAISSRIDLTTLAEELSARVDHDNAGLASAAAFDATGAFLFVALETSRQVAVVDAASGAELFRIEAGRAPQGLVVSADGNALYVHNFMDRTVGAYDLTRLKQYGEANVPLVASMAAVSSDRLSAQVLAGKRLFYDARDTRLARDAYISCASCHRDGGHDGRTWDFTGFGEGLRNTIALRGRAGAQGRLHWSANFDEVQDFEGQIRTLASGAGLMSDAQFTTGTRSQPLGDRKAGVSADLDALAAYVASLSSFDASPWRAADGSLTATGQGGRSVFVARCATCHGGGDFSDSSGGALHNVGTIKPSSGGRLGGALGGIDTPTLRDAWATAPYLHDGSAATIQDAVRAHSTLSLTTTEVDAVAEFVRQIGREEPAVSPPGTGVSSSPVFGAAGGTAFTDPVAEGQWLTGVVVRTGWWVDGIQGLATPSNLPAHGGNGGTATTVTWPAGEYPVRVFGVAGQYVGQISFVTNTGRVLGPYGSALGSGAGTAFDFTVPAGARIVGFTGRADGYLNALGVLYVQGTQGPSGPQASPVFGATTGTAFTDPVAAGQTLTGVVVHAGYWIDGLQGQAVPADLPHHGGFGGGRNVVTWPSGEHLVRIYGIGGTYIGRISFVTNTGRVLGPYGLGLGSGSGPAFDYTVPAGNRIVGFTGRAGTYVHAIGVLYAP